MAALSCEECIHSEWLPLYYLAEAACTLSETTKVEKNSSDSSSSCCCCSTFSYYNSSCCCCSSSSSSSSAAAAAAGYFDFNLSMKKKSTPVINIGSRKILKRKRQTKKENGGKNRATAAVLPNPPPLLPENIKQHIIQKMGGSDWGLVIQKKLFFTDVNPSASRFSIPFMKLKNHEFLTESEAEHLKNGKDSITVRLLEPSLIETEVNFKRWEMNKSEMYVIRKPWNNIVKKNGLKDGDVVQLWSFRVDSALCFALVKLPELSQSKNM